MSTKTLGRLQMEQLQQVWADFDRDCREWSQWDLDSYTKEFS